GCRARLSVGVAHEGARAIGRRATTREARAEGWLARVGAAVESNGLIGRTRCTERDARRGTDAGARRGAVRFRALCARSAVDALLRRTTRVHAPRAAPHSDFRSTPTGSGVHLPGELGSAQLKQF